jgi:hypothetical protein
MITSQDAKNILALLERVDLKGNEALVVAQLQQKLLEIVNTPAEKERTPVENKKK